MKTEGKKLRETQSKEKKNCGGEKKKGVFFLKKKKNRIKFTANKCKKTENFSQKNIYRNALHTLQKHLKAEACISWVKMLIACAFSAFFQLKHSSHASERLF